MKLRIILLALLSTLLSEGLYAQFSIGDIYNTNGIKGIVVKVDETGEHGLLMSLDKCTEKWYADKKNAKTDTDAIDYTNGIKNLEAVEKYLAENGKTLDLFPFFKWCKDKGEGWYPPSATEMEIIIKAINGSVGSYNATNCKKFDNILIQNGGESLYGNVELPTSKKEKMMYNMLTSTDAEGGKVYAAGFYSTSPFSPVAARLFEVSKNHSRYLGSRAVYKF